MKYMKFAPEFVPLVQDGTKTVTRRPIKPQPEHVTIPEEGFVHCDKHGYMVGRDRSLGMYGEEVVDVLPFPDMNNAVPCPYGPPGTVIQSDAGPLEIVSVKVERLQDITEDGAKREGMLCDDDPFWRPTYNDPDSGGYPSHRNSFEYVWRGLYDKTPYGWFCNPWVWVVEFKEVTE